MRNLVIAGGLIAAAQVTGWGALAGPWEDGMAAYNRGDYAPAMQVFRPLAQQGNARAQAAIGAQRDLVAQVVERQHVVRFGQADLPRQAGELDRGLGRGRPRRDPSRAGLPA